MRRGATVATTAARDARASPRFSSWRVPCSSGDSRRKGEAMMIARDLMTEAPATVGPTATVRKAVDILQTLDIRHLPVVNDDGELIGMLSDRDLRSLSIPYFTEDGEFGNLRVILDSSVASFMSSDVLSVDTEADGAEIVELMLDNKIGAGVFQYFLFFIVDKPLGKYNVYGQRKIRWNVYKEVRSVL